jgi:hypothetical protein
MKSGELVSRVGVFSDLFTGSFSAGLIDAQKLTLGGRNILDLFDKSLVDSTASAALANKVDVLGEKVDSIIERTTIIERLAQQTASQAALLHDLLNSPLGSASSSASLESAIADLDVKNATVSGELMVLGRTTLSDLGVTGVITNGVLSIHGLEGEINTIGESLKLQPLALENVEIEAGKVTIDTKGNITTKAEVTAKKYNVDESDEEGKSVGQITIKAGERSVDVTTTALTSKSRIFATPEEPVALGSKATGAATFRISLGAPAARDIRVSWWVVN